MVWGGAAAAFLIWRPIHDSTMRYGIVAALVIVWAGLITRLWQGKAGRFAAMALPLVAAIPFLLPGKELDRAKLQSDYLKGMRSFIGSNYVWGGESDRGIDCSGLPRRALRDALKSQALHGNGTAARQWIKQWWFDTSAKAMKEGYRDFTRETGIGGWMTKLDPARLEPGDLAVTDSGRHVMIYLGAGEWIQADPGPGKVLVEKPGQDDNPWFDSKVSIHRWTVLDAR
jgi:hypothetical protein